MSVDVWLGYTPITPTGVANLRKLWRTHALPEVSLTHWSNEYAREVWQVIVDWTKPETGLTNDDLLLMLDAMGVWDEDQTEQQWAPR